MAGLLGCWSQCTCSQEAEGEKGFPKKASGPVPSDPHFPVRLHSIKVAGPSQTAPPAGNQILKHSILLGTTHTQTTTLVNAASKVK